MPLPLLRAGYLAVAYKIQEAAAILSNSDVERRIDSALRADEEVWCYLVAVFGDDASGDCVYSCNGDLKKAAYTCSATGAKVDTANAVNVVPMTTYVAMSEPLSEAGARHSAADVKMLQTMHDHAVSLGAACATKESATPANAALKLTESAVCLDTIVLKEARADYEIKLIAPGKGSSAFYPSEVLKRDGPKVFGAGTHVYLNHPTAAEESQRPEGDVANLAGVLTTPAVYYESHAKGEGLFARMKVFADHATLVEEKAAHVGMSIRASGIAEAGVKRDGVPVLKELVSAESVDVVTRAGAGGMILTEAAKIPANPHEGGADDMDAAELKKLQESVTAAQAQNAKLLERAIRGDAREYVVSALKGVTLHEAGKELVLESVMRGEIPTKDGALDETKLKESVDAEAKRVGAAFAAATGSGQVRGMGGAPVVSIDAKETERREAEVKRLHEADIDTFTRIGLPPDAAKFAAKGRAS